MKRAMQVAGMGVAALMAAGCVTTGLSTRETRGHNYSTYLYALYDTAQPTEATSRPTVKLPVKVAVAQIGEVAPPQKMLEVLRQEGGLFRRVEGIPGVFDLERTDRWYANQSQESSDASRQRAQAQVKQMMRVAKDLGMDALFLYGGSVDYGARETGLSLLDATIVGGYVLPSQELKGMARVSGVLVDLASERVVFVVSAEAQANDHAATATLEGAQDRFVDRLREEAITTLTQQFLQRLRAS